MYKEFKNSFKNLLVDNLDPYNYLHWITRMPVAKSFLKLKEKEK